MEIDFTTSSDIPKGGSITLDFSSGVSVDLSPAYCLLEDIQQTCTGGTNYLYIDNIDTAISDGNLEIITKMRLGATSGSVDVYIKTYSTNTYTDQYLIDD